MLHAERILEILTEVLKPELGKLDPDAALGITDGWDSLAHLEIITRLEQESGHRLTAEDAIYAETLSDLLALFGSQSDSSD